MTQFSYKSEAMLQDTAVLREKKTKSYMIQEYYRTELCYMTQFSFKGNAMLQDIAVLREKLKLQETGMLQDRAVLQDAV